MNGALARYVCGVLSDAEERALEARLFEDPGLAAEAAQLLAIRDVLRELAAAGPLVPVLHPSELASFLASTTATEHHPVDDKIVARIAGEAFVVAHLPVPLSDARRIDVEFCGPDGAAYFSVQEAPFGADGVVVVCHSHVALAAGTLRVRVVDQDQNVRADITIENSPKSPSATPS